MFYSIPPNTIIISFKEKMQIIGLRGQAPLGVNSELKAMECVIKTAAALNQTIEHEKRTSVFIMLLFVAGQDRTAI